MRLKGKRALVTAAGQGIGRASAEAMLREGAIVFATDINMDTLGTLDGAETFAMDARDPAQIAAAAQRAQPDILVNCAGFVHNGTILDATEDDWDFAFDLNVKSMFRTIRAVLPGMLERGGGSIVNMASAASSIIGAPNRCVYGATKAAVIGLTKAVAKDYIAPGTVDTPSLHDRLRATGDYDAALVAFTARQPMGRLAQAHEIAALVVYLASDESAFMTGQAEVIDGGWSG
jgi:2-keto-3-deoxy-L-fuconate dehydrogenase